MNAVWQEIAALVLTGLAAYYLMRRLRRIAAKPSGGVCSACGNCPMAGHAEAAGDALPKPSPPPYSRCDEPGDCTTHGYSDCQPDR